jgi:hypothetical protein
MPGQYDPDDTITVPAKAVTRIAHVVSVRDDDTIQVDWIHAAEDGKETPAGWRDFSKQEIRTTKVRINADHPEVFGDDIVKAIRKLVRKMDGR